MKGKVSQRGIKSFFPEHMDGRACICLSVFLSDFNIIIMTLKNDKIVKHKYWHYFNYPSQIERPKRECSEVLHSITRH